MTGITTLLLSSLLLVAPAFARSYFVDCSRTAANSDGLSEQTAWSSLATVNAHTFGPGDGLRLKRGTTCAGMLWPKGSGAAGEPITLATYGNGPLPRIQATARDEAAFKLFNQQFWEIRHLELSGGQPYGLEIRADSGVMHHLYLRDLVVHDVTGPVSKKERGLVVITPAGKTAHFDDVLVDGVTAFSTTQWVGIVVGGGGVNYRDHANRSTHVIIRNSLVHDVEGDGIVLFGVSGGVIENSVSWNTGLQHTQTIGTPSAIWEWMCDRCVVRNNEAFLSDSPGVDGGAFDIDYGNSQNVVENNFGHDTQGYCVSIFGAFDTTVDSVIRGNTCLGNGRSPRLARRQGAIYLSTWDHGSLAGVRIEKNFVDWQPAGTAPVVMNDAKFTGGTNVVEDNVFRSTSPFVAESKRDLAFARNSYTVSGGGVPYRKDSGTVHSVTDNVASEAEKRNVCPSANGKLPADVEIPGGKWLSWRSSMQTETSRHAVRLRCSKASRASILKRW